MEPKKQLKQHLVVLDLGNYLPERSEIVGIDMVDFLFKGMVLKESEFRLQVAEFKFENYRDKLVNLYCSAAAIVPMWAYMVIASELSGIASQICFCKPDEARDRFFFERVRTIDPSQYTNQRLVVKGCGNYTPKEEIYVLLSSLLASETKALLFGEPCSTVPVFRKKT